MKFAHIHIPKTGGNTLQLILRRNFGGSLRMIDEAFGDPPLSRHQIERYLRQHPGVDCVSSHRLRLEALPESPDTWCSCVAIAVVREPLKRLVSDYHYSRKVGLEGGPANNPTFEAFVEDLAERPESGYVNMQAKFLGGIETINEWLAQDRLILIPIEKFELGMVYLRLRFPEVFSRLGYRVMNANRRGSDARVSDDAARLARERVVNEGLEVYRIAAEHFSRQIDAASRSHDIDAALSRLRSECRIYGRAIYPCHLSLNRVGSAIVKLFPV